MNKLRLSLFLVNILLISTAIVIFPQTSCHQTGAGGTCLLRGVVTDLDGQPIRGAIIELRGENGQWVVVSNVEGEYCFKDLPRADQYHLSAEAVNFIFKRVGPFRLTGPETQKKIELDQSYPEITYGISPGGVYFYQQGKKKRSLSPDDLSDEKEIWVTAIKFLISKYRNPDAPRSYFFIAISKDHDPDSDFLVRLTGKGITVQGASKSKYSKYGACIRDRKTGDLGGKITIYGITRITRDKVNLFVYWYAGALAAEDQIIRLERLDGKWKVTGTGESSVS